MNDVKQGNEAQLSQQVRQRPVLGILSLCSILSLFSLAGLAGDRLFSPPPPGTLPEISPSLGPSLLPKSSSVTSPGSELLIPVQAQALLKEFQKAQSTELKALDHQYRLELKEVQAAHVSRLQEWEKKEKEARHSYFKVHLDGPERRTYIQDFIKRREAFRKSLVNEREQRSQEQNTRVTVVRQDQVMKLQEFQKFLQKRMRPPLELWPKLGI